MSATTDRMTAAQRREHDRRERQVREAQTADRWSLARRVQWLGWRLTDAIDAVSGWVDRLRRLEVDVHLLGDDIRDARHHRDGRLDEIWVVLIRAGLLPSHELHNTLADNTDAWGRVKGCDHCEPSFGDFPWEGSLREEAEARLREAHEANRAFWEDEDEGEAGS